MTRPRIKTLTIELNRLGSFGEHGSIRSGERYLLLRGRSAAPELCEMQMSHEDFFSRLKALRYPHDTNPQLAQSALSDLGQQVQRLLPILETPDRRELLHLDLVLGAAELWAMPFEAGLQNNIHLFADKNQRMTVTRRIRVGNKASEHPWEAHPRVLFLHAPVAEDLPQALIDKHTSALSKSLKRWTNGNNPQAENLISVAIATGPTRIRKIMRLAREQGAPYTHVHILAHGKVIEDHDPLVRDVRWGLRLGHEKVAASRPEEIAAMLAPNNGLPLAVTIAACDSANQVSGAVPDRSFAHELHAQGIPIVIASQLPLTMEGSVLLTQKFYDDILQGEDGRHALHRARLQLKEKARDAHDWVSVVAYMNLPRDYSQYLLRVGVERDMELVYSARRRLDASLNQKLSKAKTLLAMKESEIEIRRCIRSLKNRVRDIPPDFTKTLSNCHGVLASSHKRIAHLHFERHQLSRGEQYLSDSKAALREALTCYRAGLEADAQNYWLAVQVVCLEAVLNGRIQEPGLWDLAFLLAQREFQANAQDCWSCSSLIELYLLAPLIDRDHDATAAKDICDEMITRAINAQDPMALDLTRNQLQRYSLWWTHEHGFFPGCDHDMVMAATSVLANLEGRG